MRILKFCFIFAALVMVLAPAYASEENALQIDNITSISSIANPATLSLARSVNAAPEWRNFIPPQAFWSPGGSRLLIRSSIRWYKDDINFRPSNRNGIDAIYTLDADGTNLTKIVSNEINNRSTPVELSAPPGFNPWGPSGDKIVIVASVPRMGGLYLFANSTGDGINVLGTNFSDITSANPSKISRQRDFTWSPEGIKAVFVVTDPVNKSEEMYVADADGFNIKQLASEVNESFLGSIAWSHDGKQIAFSGNNLWVVNSDGTGLKQLGACSGGSWSPDGSRLLIESRDNMPSKDAVLIAELSGYDRAMPVRAHENINPGEVITPEQTVDATPAPAAIADAPVSPGFSTIFAGVMLVIAMFLTKRWNT